MTTSLENTGSEFEIANHEITTIAEKMKVWCTGSELWPILYNFGYEIQNSVAMATSLVNFADTRLPADSKILNMHSIRLEFLPN